MRERTGAHRDLLWVVAGRLTGALIALISIRVSTSVLLPQQYGLLAILVTFQTFCGLFIVNPVGQYLNRHTHEWVDDDTLMPRLRWYRRYVMLAAATGATAFGGWTLTQPLSWPERILEVGVVFAMVVSATWNGTFIWILNMLGRRADSVLWASVTAAMSLLLSWLLVRQSPSATLWFAGQAAGMALGAVGAGRAVIRCLKGGLQPAGVRRLIDAHGIRTYVLPLAIATGFMWWLVSGYRLQVERYWGLAALGYAAVGLGLANQMWGLCESLAMQFLYPYYFRRIAKTSTIGGCQAFSDLLNVLGPLYLVLAAATLPCASALLTLFVSPVYADAYPFFWLGVLVECCRVLANVMGNAAQVRRRTSVLIWPYVLGAVVLVTGLGIAEAENLALQPALAILAVASGAMLLTMFIAIRREINFELDRLRWGFAALVLLASAMMTWYVSWKAHSIPAALALIGVAGAIAAIALLALLWRNPAAERLLKTQLTPRGQEEVTV